MADEPTNQRDILRARGDSIDSRYQFGFGDKPRASRDLRELELLIKDAEVLASDVAALDGEEALTERANVRLALYRRERDAIAEAIAAGPEYVEATHLGARANLVIARYRRHFAGQDRRTRDVARLDELIDDIEAVQREMARLLARHDIAELRSDLEVATENLDVYRRERETIIEARQSGSPAERASLLAGLANDQFEVYDGHFAGHARITRRASLLERVIGALESVLGEMRALGAEGLDVPTHQQNITMVGERMVFYRSELEHVHAVRDAADLFAIREAFSGEIDQILSTYNEEFSGQDRVSRDAAQLALLCDQLDEIERQLTELVTRYDLEPSECRLGLVRDALNMFQHEYEHVQKAKLN